MKMYDCDICQSAGSVNHWGICEICGEEFDDVELLEAWSSSAADPVVTTHTPVKTSAISIGQDAA